MSAVTPDHAIERQVRDRAAARIQDHEIAGPVHPLHRLDVEAIARHLRRGAIFRIHRDEALGFIFADNGEYVFESNLEEFFDDFVDEDADSFALRLYETLRSDLPKYEVETKS